VTDGDPPGGSLDGWRIVVARPAEHIAAFAELLEAAGAQVVPMPLIETVDELDDDAVRAALAPLTATDWVVVSSMHAARRVTVALDGSRAQIAAVGATTASVLGRVDLVAPQQSAAGLVTRFPSAPAAGGRVVVAQAVDGAPTLGDGLRSLGWDVTRIHTHATRSLVPDGRMRLAALAAEAVVFTSGSQARAWAEVFGSSAPPLVVAIGPQTAQDTERAGLKVDLVAADHSLPGIVRALQDFVKGS
jgi:uroporphyrinogen-III synthase